MNKSFYDKIIQKITAISIRVLPSSIKKIVKRFYTPYNILPCRFGESLIKPEKIQFLLFLLQNQIYKKIKGDVIEMGVFRGGSIIKMGLKLKELQSNKLIYGIDTFEGHPHSSEEDISENGETYHYKGKYKDTDFDRVRKVVLKRGVNNIILYKGEVNSISSLKKRRFCFAHMDIDTYISTKQGIEFLKNRMVKGGVILFDDYNDKGTVGEKKAVDELLGKENIIQTGEIGCYWIKRN